MQTASIAATFATALIPVEPVQVEQLACHLNAVGGELERAIGELMHSDLPASQSGLLIALAYKDALKCEADPLYLAKRLRTSADDMDARAEQLVEQAALDFGYASARRLKHGDDATAALLQYGAERDQAKIERLTKDACDKRIAAAEIEWRALHASNLMNIVAA